jgi:hypothetical protein
MKERWGAIEHPTIKDLVHMVLEAADKYGWENITLWKADLKQINEKAAEALAASTRAPTSWRHSRVVK